MYGSFFTAVGAPLFLCYCFVTKKYGRQYACAYAMICVLYVRDRCGAVTVFFSLLPVISSCPVHKCSRYH